MALQNSKQVIENSLTYLTTTNNINDENLFDIDDIRLSQQANSEHFIDLLNTPKAAQKVVLFNSHLNKRNEIVSFRINTPNVYVINDADGTKLDDIQVSLVWPNTDGGKLSQFINTVNNAFYNASNDLECDETYYELLFEVDLNPMSTKSFTIYRQKEDEATRSGGEKSSQITYYHRNYKSLEPIKANLEEK